MDTVEGFCTRLLDARDKLIKMGDSAANLVETYLLRVRSANRMEIFRERTFERIAGLKNEHNVLALQVSQMEAQLRERDMVSSQFLM